MIARTNNQKLTAESDNEVLIPNDVIQLLVKYQCNLLGAWRRYRKLTQGEFADKMGITQSAVSQIEKSDNPHSDTITAAAKALECLPEQLTD